MHTPIYLSIYLSIYESIFLYVCMYVCMYIYIYIYIYKERERERERCIYVYIRETERQREKGPLLCAIVTCKYTHSNTPRLVLLPIVCTELEVKWVKILLLKHVCADMWPVTPFPWAPPPARLSAFCLRPLYNHLPDSASHLRHSPFRGWPMGHFHFLSSKIGMYYLHPVLIGVSCVWLSLIMGAPYSLTPDEACIWR